MVSQVVEMALIVEVPKAMTSGSLHHLGEGRRHKRQCLRHPRGWGAGGLAQTSLLEVCDAPKGHLEERRSGLASMPGRSLREIAGSKNHLLKIKRIAQIGERAGHRDRFS